jgi:hypothetical protein
MEELPTFIVQLLTVVTSKVLNDGKMSAIEVSSSLYLMILILSPDFYALAPLLLPLVPIHEA